MRKWSIAGALSALVLVGCADPNPRGDDGSASGARPGTGGSSASGGSGGTGGSSETDGGGLAGCGGAPATRNAAGVLTSLARIRTVVTPPDFAMKTVNFYYFDTLSGRMLTVLAEVQNTGTTTQCNLKPQITLGELAGGNITFIAVVYVAPMYRTDSGLDRFQCVGPGEVTVVSGQAPAVLAQDSEGLLTITLTPNNVAGPYTPALEGPHINANIVQAAGGWAVRGQVQAQTTIYDFGLQAMPRDSRGLLVAELSWAVFPTDLAAGSSVDFETEATSCAFSEYLLFDWWTLESL